MEIFKTFFLVFAFLGLILIIVKSSHKDFKSPIFNESSTNSKSNNYKALQFLMNFYYSIGMLINVIVILTSIYYLLVTNNFVTQLIFRHRSTTFGNEPFESNYFFGILFGGILTGVTCMGLSQGIKLLFEIKDKNNL